MAPIPVKVAELPEHIDGEELDAITVGNGTTVRLEVVELVQLPLLPTMV